MRSGFLSPGSPPDWSTPTRTSRSWLTSTYPPHPHHHHHKTGMATNAFFLFPFVKNPSFVDDSLNQTLRGFLSWFAKLQWSPNLASYEASGTTKAPSGLLLLEDTINSSTQNKIVLVTRPVTKPQRDNCPIQQLFKFVQKNSLTSQ